MTTPKQEREAAKLAIRIVSRVREERLCGYRSGPNTGATNAAQLLAGNLSCAVVAMAETWALAVLSGELAETKLTEWVGNNSPVQ